MNYRLATQNDVEQIRELCHEESLSMPLLQMCFVAVDDYGKIVGFINVANFPTIDTMIVKNKLAAMRLFDMAIGGISASGNKYVKCYTLRENVVDVAERSGFVINDRGATILTKEL